MHCPFPMPIVLVQDDPGHARLIEHSLRRVHLTNAIGLLRDDQAALDSLFPNPRINAPPDRPYLLLLDVGLPMVDGYIVLERLKCDERTHHMPVIILSTVEVPAAIDRCYALGCNVYMTKPV